MGVFIYTFTGGLFSYLILDFVSLQRLQSKLESACVIKIDFDAVWNPSSLRYLHWPFQQHVSASCRVVSQFLESHQKIKNTLHILHDIWVKTCWRKETKGWSWNEQGEFCHFFFIVTIIVTVLEWPHITLMTSITRWAGCNEHSKHHVQITTVTGY